jgi:hypothetical protein
MYSTNYNNQTNTNKVVLPVSSTSSSLASVNRPVDAVHNNKAIMIGFDDGWKSQIQYAKPILDRYGISYNNGFKVLSLNQFGFDPNRNVLYLKTINSSIK